MTYTIELDSQTDAIIADRAKRRGLTVPEYFKQLAEEDTHEEAVSFGQQWIAVFGDRPAGTGNGNWSEVEGACDPH